MRHVVADARPDPRDQHPSSSATGLGSPLSESSVGDSDSYVCAISAFWAAATRAELAEVTCPRKCSGYLGYSIARRCGHRLQQNEKVLTQ